MATPGSNSFNTPNGFPQSTILGMTDMDAIRPDVSETLFNTYGDQYSSEFRLWMKLHGGMIQTQNPQGGRLFQETRYDDFAEVLADGTPPTSGTTLKFDLAPSQIYTIGGNYYVYPQVGDLIADLTTMNRGRITSVVVGATTTITAVSLTGANWVTPVPGKKYAIFSNAREEASGDPKARIAYWFSKSYKIQILREKADTTDLASGAQLFPVQDQLGNATQYWGSVAFMQMERRLHKQIYNTLWLGTENSVSGQPSTTTGYYDQFSTQANSVNVGAGDYVQSFFDLNDALLENSPMTQNYWVIIKRNLNNELQTDLNDYFQNLNIVRVQKETAVYLFGEGATEGMLGLFDFNTLIFNGTTYSLHNDKAGYDPIVQGLDPTANLFANTGYVMPSKVGTDAEGQVARNCMLRYFSPKNINLVGPQKIYHWQLGGLATVPTNANLNLEDHAAMYMGAQFCNLPQCGFLYKNVGS